MIYTVGVISCSAVLCGQGLQIHPAQWSSSVCAQSPGSMGPSHPRPGFLSLASLTPDFPMLDLSPPKDTANLHPSFALSLRKNYFKTQSLLKLCSCKAIRQKQPFRAELVTECYLTFSLRLLFSLEKFSSVINSLSQHLTFTNALML